MTATQTADICGVNRNTVNHYYNLLHRAILIESVREARREFGEYELDESYFGARRFAESAGDGWKLSLPQGSPKYGSFETSESHEEKLGKHAWVRREKVFVTVVPDCPRESLMLVIKGIILEQSKIYTDG